MYLLNNGKNMQLDQKALNLAKAIRRTETGNQANPYTTKGPSGEFGAYQFTSSTYKNLAKQYLGNPNASPTVENQNKIAYSEIKRLKDSGHTPAEIASYWNSGNTKSYKTGLKGVNKFGVKYDVPAYVAKVSKIYKSFSNNQNVNAPNMSTPTGSVYTPPNFQTRSPQKTSVFGKIENVAKDIVRGTLKPAVTLATRPFQLAKELIQPGEQTPQEQSVNLPFFGKIPAPQNQSDVIKDVGRGLETVALGFGGGGIGETAGQALKVPLKDLALKSAIETGKIGTVFGAGSEIANKGSQTDLSGLIKSSALGGASGFALGGATPFVAKGAQEALGSIGSRLTRQSPQKIEQESLLKAGIPDTRIATKKIINNKVVKDKSAEEAIKQGIDKADVALIKTAKLPDKIKMAKMLDIRERQLTNRRMTERATDIAGDTYIQNVAKFLEKKNKEAGKKLNIVAKGLAGKKVDLTKPLTEFSQELDNIGITLNSKGGLNFKGSAFEDVPSVQSSINNVWNRTLRIMKSGDALEVHRLKSYIDSIVDYGVDGGGLKGNASRILKGFRRSVDSVLDTKFDAYNKVNTQYTDTIQQMSKIASLLGKKFRIGDKFADARMGLILRRILSNAQSRSEVLRLLDESQKVAQSYGAKTNEDIINQVYFADVLEKIFGSEAPGSFLGQGQRFRNAEKVVSAGADIARGGSGLISGPIKLTKYVSDTTRGISNKNKIKALRELLGNVEKNPKTVFGKKKVDNVKISKSKIQKLYRGGTPSNKLFIGSKGKLSGQNQPVLYFSDNPTVANLYKELDIAKGKKKSIVSKNDFDIQKFKKVKYQEATEYLTGQKKLESKYIGIKHPETNIIGGKEIKSNTYIQFKKSNFGKK